MSGNDNSQTSYRQYLNGGGEMGELTRSFDWSETALGSPEKWSQSLLTMLSVILNSKFPMFLWWGSELIQFYNDAYRPSLGNHGKHPKALGQRGEDCWPEIWLVIKPLIDQVMSGGDAVWSEDHLIPIYRNNKLEDVYWTFGYSRVNDETGKPAGVLVVCNETTDKVEAYNAVKEAKNELEHARIESERQRDRLKRFFMQAPAGICILDGADLVFELINPVYQQLFPGRSLLGRPILEGLPELKGQPVWDILQDVYRTGKTFEGKGLHVPLARHDHTPVEDRYFNFIYQPRYNNHGRVDGILVFVFEVTEMIISKIELEKQQNKLKIAMMAAELGTFDMDFEKNIMEWDERCRTLFGISHKNPVTYENDFMTGLHPHDYQKIKHLVYGLLHNLENNSDYNVEFRTIGKEDQKLRWVKAMGKASFDRNNKPIRFTGTILDITKQKQDEVRKNDFIAMVSHELKTPLTSMKAYVQVLIAKTREMEDVFVETVLKKVNNQIKKMTEMINSFLDISRLESGKIHLEKRNFCLGDLLTEIVEDIHLIAQGHRVSLLPCDSLNVHADYEKIGQVVNNLLSNAFKYSPKGKRIEISCCQNNNMAVVSVKDEGIGIKSQDVIKLFERFYRVEGKHTQTISGFGIGLYLCAEIIQHHNGKIWVESKIGKGSVFHFSLPLAEPSRAIVCSPEH